MCSASSKGVRRVRRSTAHDRDDRVINGVFSAGMILQSTMPEIDSPNAARHVGRALEALDDGLNDVRRAALTRHLGAGADTVTDCWRPEDLRPW